MHILRVAGSERSSGERLEVCGVIAERRGQLVIAGIKWAGRIVCSNFDVIVAIRFDPANLNDELTAAICENRHWHLDEVPVERVYARHQMPGRERSQRNSEHV